MLTTLAVSGYRSLRDVVVPLSALTVVTGGNGSGKSSLYRALRLLADCGQGRVIGSLAREGGLPSALWAGPESPAGARRRGQPVQGTVRTGPVALRLGFAADDIGYLIDLGKPQDPGYFTHDPEIKQEAVFAGPVPRPSALLARRTRGVVELRDGRAWRIVTDSLPPYRSMLSELSDPVTAPELTSARDQLRQWRFYDGFRADADAPARRPQIGTRTPAMADDGADLAAALATILEADDGPIRRAVAEAFDGAELIVTSRAGIFDVGLRQPGMLRPLGTAELSDGTLRFLLWTVALHSLQPPPLMVLNEPETSLHPQLLPALGDQIARAATRTQVLVVSHSRELIDRLGVRPLVAGDQETASAAPAVDRTAAPAAPTAEPARTATRTAPERAPAQAGVEIALERDQGQTRVRGLGPLDAPPWEWGSR